MTDYNKDDIRDNNILEGPRMNRDVQASYRFVMGHRGRMHKLKKKTREAQRGKK